MRTFVVALICSLLIPKVASSQQAKPEILIVGTYHMANPGRDIHSTNIDDVLAPRRQREIAQLIEVLKRFRPTKVAVEAEPGRDRVGRYQEFLEGKYALSRNEIDQIGFRLAKELGHKAVYGVDADGDFPYARVSNFAKAKGMNAKFDSLQAAIGEEVKRQNDFFASHSVLENLVLLNSDSMVAKRVAFDFNFVTFGDRYDFAGPDLLAAWYQRNIRIYHNIVRLIDSPAERILVIYGSGHVGPLKEDANNHPAVRLRELGDFVR